MPEFALTESTIKAALTLLILFASIYSFVRERISPDLTALLAVLALLLTGVLTPLEAFAGFSHPATVSVAAVLVLSAGIEKTGALSAIARRLLLPLGHSEILLTGVIMVAIGLFSAFINNTAAVAVFIPVVLEICRRAKVSAGRVLMPMSHAATIGGMCTLIGTSTNLVAHEYARSQGLPGFSMFELGKVGIPMVIVAYLYMLFVGRLFLPKGDSVDSTDSSPQTEKYLSELVIADESPWIGRQIDKKAFERDFDLELLGVLRNGGSLDIQEEGISYLGGDSLLVRGSLEHILKFISQKGLAIHKPDDRNEEVEIFSTADRVVDMDPLKLAEVVVLTPSGLVGRTLSESRFAETYDTFVVALRRRGEAEGRPTTIPLHAGDILVVEGTSDALEALAERKGFLVIGDVKRPKEQPGKILITLITLIGVILSVSLGVVPIVTAAVAGCAILILTSSLKLREAYRAIDMSIVFLLAGSLALGAALEKTGITTVIANGLTSLGGDVHPIVMIAAFLFAAIIISEFMSNSGTVPLLAPIALAVAAKTGIPPMALIAAVTFGSTAAFAMPIGYQTSLMIYGVGGYRVKDFVRMGIVLDILLALLALLLIPLFWM
ncbi:MAG: SLC13 family permease [Pyrinomonadaceae bacterium]